MDFPEIDRVEEVQDFLSEIGDKGLIKGLFSIFSFKRVLITFSGKISIQILKRL